MVMLVQLVVVVYYAGLKMYVGLRRRGVGKV